VAEPFSYQRYLASREWGKRKNSVRMRSGGICERCREAKATAVHHLTYANIGNEPLEDLQHVCGPCHQFLSGTADVDPAVAPITLQSLVADRVGPLRTCNYPFLDGRCPHCGCDNALSVHPIVDLWFCWCCRYHGFGIETWLAFLVSPMEACA
jgi:hypothetical protein